MVILLFWRGGGASSFSWQLGQQPVQIIQGIAEIGMKIQQVRPLPARMVQVDESWQPKNPPPVPDVVATDGNS